MSRKILLADDSVTIQKVIELTTEQLHWLLDGIDIDAVRRHPVRHYQHVD